MKITNLKSLIYILALMFVFQSFDTNYVDFGNQIEISENITITYNKYIIIYPVGTTFEEKQEFRTPYVNSSTEEIEMLSENSEVWFVFDIFDFSGSNKCPNCVTIIKEDDVLEKMEIDIKVPIPIKIF